MLITKIFLSISNSCRPDWRIIRKAGHWLRISHVADNSIFNILFFLMLVIFAASFFGAFEIRLPSKWGNAVDSKAESTTGLLSIFLMAFTLSLVSFSCTGPIIGFLLVQVSTTGSVVAPAIGMLDLPFLWHCHLHFLPCSRLG